MVEEEIARCLPGLVRRDTEEAEVVEEVTVGIEEETGTSRGEPTGGTIVGTEVEEAEEDGIEETAMVVEEEDDGVATAAVARRSP